MISNRKIIAAVTTGLLLTAGCGGVEQVASPAPVPTSDTPTTTTTPTTDTPTTTETTSSETTTTEEETTTSETEETEAARRSTTGSYDVTLSGSVSGHSFSRPATLRVVDTISSSGTTNDVNPVDVCLVSGSPAGRPQPGAIRFGSNTGCLPGSGAADLDLASVDTDGDTITVEPVENMAATGGNLFTSSSSIAACPFFPKSGRLRVTIDGGDVSGRIEVTGYGGAFCGTTVYDAKISG
ncbi:hypothetical protein M8542_16620 [Amycolatopsis sp. OK19-0408]|uniref:Lipoprotein n=1 Tax=Amycolatopsis iheyensis TaxID=2945988 RepID=A0A9X2SJH2_9PSEU|nr:hypothetical protein [Amycolatopsis iheyensis]MCR6484449.1 hypothetical protein [Amycolatopsis iheyensis]